MSKLAPGFRSSLRAERQKPEAEVLWADSICKN
jgi:hypothetical protein